MTWNDVTLSLWEKIEGKTIEEALYILGADMTIDQFKKEDWTFLTKDVTPEAPKEKYIIDGKEREATLDIRKFSVSQYLNFIQAPNLNGRLNAVFKTEDVDYGNMSIVDVESIMSFFVKQWQTCLKGTQKYLETQVKNPEMKQKLTEALQQLGNLVSSYSSNQ